MTPKLKSSSSSSDDQAAHLNYKFAAVVRSKRSEESKLEKIRMLLQDGADINFQDANNRNNTFLHIAIRRNELKVVAVLMEGNANIHLKNCRNKSALQVADEMKSSDIVDVLMKRKWLVWQNNEWNISNIQYDRITLTQNKNNESSKYKYKKGIGDSGSRGQYYEISLLTLFLMRGQNETNNFYLGCNLANAGAFDDVVFQYCNNNAKSRLILLQAKHRDNLDHREIHLSTFMEDKDFALHKYFSSYKTIKTNFNKAGDPIFQNQFENILCDFVIYTNARLDKDLDDLICNDAIGNDMFRIGNGGKAIKLRWSDMYQYLGDKEMEEHVTCVAKAFVEFIFSKHNEKKMADTFVRVYHVFWANKVIEVKIIESDANASTTGKFKKGKVSYSAQFRGEFLSRCHMTRDMEQFRKDVFEEYAKIKMIIQKGKDNNCKIADNINDNLMQFAEFLSKCKSKEMEVINELDVVEESIIDIMSNLIGVIITYDSKNKNLKFAPRDHLGPSAIKVMEAFDNVIHVYGIQQDEIQKLRFNTVDAVVRKKLKLEDLKVPDGFGNIKPTFLMPLENVCLQFVETLKGGEIILGNTCVIKEMSKKLLRDVCMWVGSVLVINETTGYFTLNDKTLSGQEGIILDKLANCLHNYEINITVEFDIQIESFPRLKLCCPTDIDMDIKNFLSSLTIFTNQPSVSEMRDIIRKEMKEYYQLTNDERDSNYLVINNKMKNYWEQTGKVKYLTKGYSFFREMLRQPMHYFLRYPVKSFTGRVKELEHLHKLLASEQNNEGVILTQVTTICGLGGIGKSELARKYASIYGDCYDNNIIWIDADNFATMADSFRKLSRNRLNIPTDDGNGRVKQMKHVVQDVYKFFSKRKSLFIFDNAQRYSKDESGSEDGIGKFLPCSPFAGDAIIPSFIITSRCKTWPNKKVLYLRTLTQDEAVEFVTAFLKIKDDSQNSYICKLTEMLQCLLLALQHAVAYIREKDEDSKIMREYKSFTIRDYLNLYETHATRLLNFKFPEDSLDLYTKTAFTTFDITLQTIRARKNGKKACAILDIMGYLSPNDIPLEMFLEMVGSNNELMVTIELLSRYSLIDLENKYASIHRVTQHVIRLKSQHCNQNIVQTGLLMLQEKIKIREFTDHCLSIWSYASKHDKLVKKFAIFPSNIVDALNTAIRFEEAFSFGERESALLNTVLGIDHPCAIRAQHSVSIVLHRQGKFEEALRTLQDIGERTRRVLGADHPETLTTQHNISQVLFDQGKYGVALDSFNKVLEKRLDIFGHGNPRTLSTKHSIAEVWSNQGQYDLALSSHKDVLEKTTRLLGPDNPETIALLNNIGQVMTRQGKYDDALRYYQEALHRQAKSLSTDHVLTLKIQDNIAQVLSLKGKYDDALLIYERVAEQLTLTLGPDHPDTLYTLDNISQVLFKQGKCSKALCSFKSVLDKMIKTLGPQHPRTMATNHNIAQVLSNQGKYDEALTYYQEVYDTTKSTLGPDHPDALTTLNNIAQVLSNQGKYEEALRCYDDVLQKRLIALGSSHQYTIATRHNIAQVLSNQGKYSEALNAYQEVLEQENISLGSDHPDTFTTLHNIALILVQLGKLDEAVNMYADVLQNMEKTFGPDHPDTLNMQHNAGEILIHQEKYAEAHGLYKELLEKKVTFLGPSHPDTLVTKANFAQVLSAQGQYEASLVSYNSVFQELSKTLGPAHPEMLMVRNNMAQVLSKQGKYMESLDHFQDIFNRMNILLGPKHARTLAAQHNIAQSLSNLGKYDEALILYRDVLERTHNYLGPITRTV